MGNPYTICRNEWQHSSLSYRYFVLPCTHAQRHVTHIWPTTSHSRAIIQYVCSNTLQHSSEENAFQPSVLSLCKCYPPLVLSCRICSCSKEHLLQEDIITRICASSASRKESHQCVGNHMRRKRGERMCRMTGSRDKPEIPQPKFWILVWGLKQKLPLRYQAIKFKSGWMWVTWPAMHVVCDGNKTLFN